MGSDTGKTEDLTDSKDKSDKQFRLKNITFIFLEDQFAKDKAESAPKIGPVDSTKLVDQKPGQAKNSKELMGMNEKTALLASRDSITESTCSGAHIHDDLANRWCHGTMANNFSEWLQSKGVNKAIACGAGGVFWLPKETLVDLHPSASDMVFTCEDKLGTKSTTFKMTVFGDAVFTKRLTKEFAPLKKSTPFITITRKF